MSTKSRRPNRGSALGTKRWGRLVSWAARGAVAAAVFVAGANSLAAGGFTTSISKPFVTPDGQPLEDVRTVLEAPDGALWFASLGRGVARLRGTEWRVFTRADGLPSDYVREITADPHGGIWAATKQGAAYIGADYRISVLNNENTPTICDPRVNCITFLHDGRMLFGLEDGHIAVYHGPHRDLVSGAPTRQDNWSIILNDASRGDQDSVWQILETRDGTVWAARTYSGVSRLQNGGWTHFGSEHFLNRQMKSLCETPDGVVWAAGSGAPFYFDGSIWHMADTPGSSGTAPDATCVSTGPHGSLLIGTARDGVLIREGGEWRPLEHGPAFGTPVVRAITFDSARRGWFGTKEGVTQYVPAKWQDLSHTPRETQMREGHAFHASPQQPPLAVDLDGNVVTFVNGSWQTVGTLPAVADIQDMAPPVDNIVAILMDHAVYDFSLIEKRVVGATLIPETVSPQHLFRAQCGLYAFGAGGICKRTGDRWELWNPPGMPKGAFFSAMTEMPDGAIVFCAGYPGTADAFVWRDDEVTRLLDQDDVTPVSYLASAGTSRDGSLLIGTLGDGVWTWNPRFEAGPSIRDGLPSNRISAIYNATDGGIWLGTETAGVACLYENRITSFSRDDGLPSDIIVKFGEYPAGVVWVVTRNFGVYRHEADAWAPSTSIHAHPTRIPHKGAAVISFTGYDAWNVTLTTELGFSWRIVKEGAQNEDIPWSPFSHETTIVTPPLRAGKYVFEVRASDEDRNVDPSPARAAFTVLPPFYVQPDFIVPVVLLLMTALALAAGNHAKNRALRQSQTEILRLGQAVEQAAESIVVTDPNGVIQYVNPAFERLTGYTRHEAVGQKPSILKSGKHDERFYRDLWETVLSGQNWNGRLVNKKKDGTLIEEEVSISPVRDRNGRVIHFVAVKKDITEQVKLEAQLRHSQKMEAVGQLAGGVAHDFNNLIQAIQGYTQLTMEALGEDNPHYNDLSEVIRAAEQAAALSRQLLSFSRLEVLQPRNLDLNRVIDEMAKMLRRIIGEHIELRVHKPEPLKPVCADPTQIGQVLINLAVNARDAIPPEGGVITIETEMLVADAEYCQTHPWAKPGEYAIINVSDNGVGMTPEVQERIFEPFFTTKELGRGTGLGLATVYGIIKQHEGIVSVYSEPGRGSTFRICLPVVTGAYDAERAAAAKPLPQGAGTVLLAEDDDAVRRLGEQILSTAGYTVLTAYDGENAVDVFMRHASQIDVVILDVIMPKLSGRTACERIRSVKPEVPVLFTTGYSLSLIDSSYLRTANAACLQKPYGPRALLEKLQEIIGR